ncbi:hypothetical protein TARUN_3662 [Trichoderma arundinaceum]|uniref:Uncharacterized protein n=1 Tax=Trichoderma arundinaceum TaxID=490622 RepID=A0A395NRD3_TRIAR|nr:hypothetical protein TARUN_3662 [Trichoderma arundinaceum]
MDPNNPGNIYIDTENQNLRQIIQGTFHNTELPQAVVDAVPMTTYVTPHIPQLGGYIIGAPGLTADINSPPDAIFPYVITPDGVQHPVARYTKCMAESGCDQINGLVVVCDPDPGDEDVKIEPGLGKYFYTKCKKLGSGAQVNGMEVVYHGGSRIPKIPAVHGIWDGMDFLNAEGKEIKGMPKNQINGGRLRLMKRTEMGTSVGRAGEE